MVYLIGNDSFKDYLGPCKFHYSFCFSLFYDIKSETLYLSFSGGVCYTNMMFYICCLIKCVSACEFCHIFRFLHLHLMEKQTF